MIKTRAHSNAAMMPEPFSLEEALAMLLETLPASEEKRPTKKRKPTKKAKQQRSAGGSRIAT